MIHYTVMDGTSRPCGRSFDVGMAFVRCNPHSSMVVDFQLNVFDATFSLQEPVVVTGEELVASHPLPAYEIRVDRVVQVFLVRYFLTAVVDYECAYCFVR